MTFALEPTLRNLASVFGSWKSLSQAQRYEQFFAICLKNPIIYGLLKTQVGESNAAIVNKCWNESTQLWKSLHYKQWWLVPSGTNRVEANSRGSQNEWWAKLLPDWLIVSKKVGRQGLPEGRRRFVGQCSNEPPSAEARKDWASTNIKSALSSMKTEHSHLSRNASI